VAELSTYDPQITPTRLWQAGLGVGREVLGSMVNTLILAYLGGSLPFVVLIAEAGPTFFGFFNDPSIAEEIVRSLAGTMGLLLTVPITAFLGMWWHRRDQRMGGQQGKPACADPFRAEFDAASHARTRPQPFFPRSLPRGTTWKKGEKDASETEFSFDAAHRLEQYHGKCEALHGHTYRFAVTIGW
jgi:hypothetical protein